MEASPSSATVSLITPDPLLERFIEIFSEELGLRKDWWLTHFLATSGFVTWVFFSSMALSISAGFHVLCFVFVVGMKWSRISKFIIHLKNAEGLGVF